MMTARLARHTSNRPLRLTVALLALVISKISMTAVVGAVYSGRLRHAVDGEYGVGLLSAHHNKRKRKRKKKTHPGDRLTARQSANAYPRERVVSQGKRGSMEGRS